MGSVKRQIDPANLAVSVKIEKGQRIATVVHTLDGFVVVNKAAFQSSAFELELARVLAGLGVEPDHELADTRDVLEDERARAVRDLAALKEELRHQQGLATSLTDRVSELEGELAATKSRLAGVELERSEFAGRLAAYDSAAREMSKMGGAGVGATSDFEREGPPTKPGE